MRYHNITKDDMLNGDGLRVVLWVSGCSHCCKECHNPITWDPNVGLIFDEAARQEIFHELEKDYVSGITFSGGDPLHIANTYEVTALAREIREKYPEKTIWLDISGKRYRTWKLSGIWTCWWTENSKWTKRITSCTGRAVPTSGSSMFRRH